MPNNVNDQPVKAGNNISKALQLNGKLAIKLETFSIGNLKGKKVHLY